MSPRFKVRRENVSCVVEVVNRSLKADCTDFITICADEMLNYCSKKSYLIEFPEE